MGKNKEDNHIKINRYYKKIKEESSQNKKNPNTGFKVRNMRGRYLSTKSYCSVPSSGNITHRQTCMLIIIKHIIFNLKEFSELTFEKSG